MSAVMDVDVVGTTEIVDAEVIEEEYVGFVTRVIAFAIDAALINLAGVLVALVVTLVYSVLPDSEVAKTVAVAGGAVAFAIWWVAYFVTFWTTTGQTPGSRAMRIRVIRARGDRLRPRHAIVRLAGLLLSLPLLWGFVPILLDERRRGVFDRLAGTEVVATDPPV